MLSFLPESICSRISAEGLAASMIFSTLPVALEICRRRERIKYRASSRERSNGDKLILTLTRRKGGAPKLPRHLILDARARYQMEPWTRNALEIAQGSD